MGLRGADLEEYYRQFASYLQTLVPGGERLLGHVVANSQRFMRSQLYLVGITEQHLILAPVDRKWQPAAAPPVVAQRHDLSNVRIWGSKPRGAGADVKTSMVIYASPKGQQLRFEVHGRKFGLYVLGGNALEDLFANDAQQDGLGLLVEFLRAGAA